MAQAKEYAAVKAISNSVLSLYEEDFVAFVQYWVMGVPYKDELTKSLSMGSAIDILLTRKGEEDEFIHIFDGDTPRGQMLTFCKEMSRFDEDNPDVMKGIYQKMGIKKDSYETFCEERYPKEGKAYVDQLRASKNKIVLAPEEMEKAKAIVHELRHDKYTAAIVNAETMKTEKLHLDVFNQLELFGEYHSKKHGVKVPTKGALDKVIVDHNRKKIIPVDFKSSFDVNNFVRSYLKYKYYRQGSYYTYLLKKWAEDNGWGDYRISEFVFLACSTTGGKHFYYQMSQNDLMIASIGGFLKNGFEVKGWRELLEEICYLEKHAQWSYPYEAHSNNGIVTLDVFKNPTNE